jgi:hypothetical protein
MSRAYLTILAANTYHFPAFQQKPAHFIGHSGLADDGSGRTGQQRMICFTLLLFDRGMTDNGGIRTNIISSESKLTRATPQSAYYTDHNADPLP